MTTPLSMVNALLPADAVNFDNLPSFTSAQPIQVTAHPVEFGVEVSDHAQKMPNELIFSVQVTKSPLGIPTATTVESATAWFERNSGKAVNITAPAGIFSNYVITRWDYAQRPGDRVFNVTAREVRFALAVSVPVPARIPNPVAANGLASASASGVQPPTPAPPPPADTSFLGTLAGLL
jgi:hypothetical protein